LCFSAIILATIDIILGFFPLYNLIVLLAPTAYLMLLFSRKKFRFYPVLYNTLFSTASILSCIAIIFTYHYFTI
jgi:hypothetical protein